MTPDLGNSTTRLTTLSSTLWRLREVLDHLLFKIFETQLILQSDAERWLAKAGRELDAALQELRHVEVMRAVEAVALADHLQEPADITLRELADRAPAPWTAIFDEHREALLSLTASLEEAASRASRSRARSGQPARPPRRRLGDAPERPMDVDMGDQMDVELVRRFLADTLENARQISLTAFLA